MFQELFQNLPDGAVWIKGSDLKLLGRMLDADRARLAATSGNELPTPLGRFFDVAGNGGASAETFSKPWQVKVKNFGSTDEPIWKFIVYRDSRLLASSKYSDQETVDGKAAAFVPSDEDPGWHAFVMTSGGVRVWIECILDTTDETWGDMLSGDIRWDGGGSWGGGELQYVDTGDSDNPNYVHKYARKIIAVIYDRDGDGTYKVDQWVDTHLQMQYTGGEAYDSGGGTPKTTALRYPFPMG